jgi:UDP-N-acetylmuramate--alanine ligase
LFGISKRLDDRFELDYSADQIRCYSTGSTFDFFSKGKKLGEIQLKVAGEHNVMNALAAISISLEAGIAFNDIVSGLNKFSGVGRRLEKLWEKGIFQIIDDYGHHPTEIKATLTTLKNIYKKKVCVVFEPHRYTRTQQLWSDFLTSFDDAFEVHIAPIYAASEPAIKDITSEKLVESMKLKKPNVYSMSSLDQMLNLIQEKKEDDVILLTLGAGSISKKIRSIIKEL